ncbi:MAG: hypothetical protein K9G70_11775 [Prolixibacteraceae bacterium]|nr:hypothetical protein [Prolixibacteraceae bacterium]
MANKKLALEWFDFARKNLYYQSERYPGPRYFMPEREEITSSIHFAENILEQVYNLINKHE